VICIIGLGRTGTTALTALLERGHSNFAIADEYPVYPSDPAFVPLFRAEDIGRSRPDVVAERLGSRYPAATFSIHAGPERGLGWYLEWLRDGALCLFAADAATPLALWRVNAACLDQRVPLFPGLVMGTAGQVGPVVVTGSGPCLGCLELRVRTATRRSPFPPPVSPDHIIADRVAFEIATEAERFLAAGRSAAASGTHDMPASVKYLWADGGAGTHPLLRAPACPECGAYTPQMPFHSPRSFELQNKPGSDSGRILGLAPVLVDPVTGPIKTFTEYEPGPTDPALHHWVTALADPAWDSFGRDTVFCGGNALSTEVAQAAALGEAVERSSTCQVSYDDLLVARHCDIAGEALDPLAWDLFDPRTRAAAGFPYTAPSRQAELSWVWGFSLTQKRPVRVPASRTFSPFRAVTPGDFFDAPIISGYSTHATIEQAIYSALMEVIERDAFMIAWANQLRLPRLAIDPATRGEVGEYLAAFAARGIEVRCVLVDLDLGAHAVIAIARSHQTGDPSSVVAAAADMDAEAACRKALKELSANRLSVRHEMVSAGDSLPLPDPQSVIDERTHGLLYARPDMASSLDIWWRSENCVPLPRPSQETGITPRLRNCIEVLMRAELEVTVVDLTAPAMESLGLRTVKVLVPGAYPMNFDGRFPHFGGKRMSQAPVTAGLRDTPINFEDLCTIPHPFP
jgi:ribosomal protein S12 methylthiotransferase accessory factor